MDNTLKILLGVLSVTGFITVVIPQGNPIAPREAADVTNAEVNAPRPNQQHRHPLRHHLRRLFHSILGFLLDL